MAETVGWLPKGLQIERTEREPKWIDIAQADPEGPVFQVKLKYVPYKKFKALLDVDAVGNSKAAQQRASITAQRRLMNEIVLDWRGLTLENLVEVLRVDGEVGFDPSASGKDAMKPGDTIAFSQETLWGIYLNSYPDSFQNVFIRELQNWTQEITREDQRGNAA